MAAKVRRAGQFQTTTAYTVRPDGRLRVHSLGIYRITTNLSGPGRGQAAHPRLGAVFTDHGLGLRFEVVWSGGPGLSQCLQISHVWRVMALYA